MTTETLPSAPVLERAVPGKYLTFNLGEECYAVPVLKIREIICLVKVTPVPQMPSHIRGVINLRGKIIPVVDLRLKCGLPSAESTEHTCIVVVQVRAATGKDILLGLLVDSVEEVAQISQADLEATPDFGSQLDTEYIQGMAKLKNRVLILLDIDKALVTQGAAAGSMW